MSKGIIIHLDNDVAQVIEPSKNLFDQLNIPIEYIGCSTTQELEELVKQHRDNLKCIVFDLLDKDTDEQLKNPQKSSFYPAIQQIFSTLNVPIFIYSGYLENYEEFKYSGTVFKIDKGNENGFKAVSDKIKLFHDSGYLEIFCPNGILEKKLHSELHEAFVKQFVNNDAIQKIIEAINSSGENTVQRTQDVFSRIALRSLMGSLMIDKSIQDVQFDEVIINAIELYFRRINIEKTPVWTGDIFSNANGNNCIVLTPRCDLASKKKENFLICRILKAEVKGKDVLTFLRDNIKEKKFRYLPATPFFEGGIIDLSEHYTILKKDFLNEFTYQISLLDDLTNEILAKFCSYLLRTSIPDANEKELQTFLKQ